MLISVIIPTRNRPDYVIESATSVLRQSHSDLELIMVNDGTTPVPAFSDTRVRVFTSGEAGAVPARNMGVSQAKGEAIAWLDDDDQWTDDLFLEDCVRHMKAGIAFLFGDGDLAFPDGTRRTFSKDANAKTLERDNTILISSVCYVRHLHDMLGPFDETLPYYWDWDWYLRVARADHALKRIDRPVVDIRIHAHNMSGQANAAARKANLDAFARKHSLPEIPLKSHIDFV
jgi:glycosyltransferase involved in cell wall biosynthesis